MIGPIFYILLIVLLVALPAIAGWKLSRKRGQAMRMAGTILGGQLILSPGIVLMTLSGNGSATENPAKTMMTYAAMAIVISIMTFVVLEIRSTSKTK